MYTYSLAYCIITFYFLGDEPETWTMVQFGTNYLIYLLGQAIANIHIALGTSINDVKTPKLGEYPL